jgi:hypothetical protein
MNELAILASGQDVATIVREFDGEITVSVPQTDTYQVKFPVSDLEELNEIARELEERGLRAQHVIIMRPPIPGGPQ